MTQNLSKSATQSPFNTEQEYLPGDVYYGMRLGESDLTMGEM